MSQHTLRVAGLKDESEPGKASRGGPFFEVVQARTTNVVAVDLLRSGGRESVKLEGLAPDDVVELEFEDGIRRWTRVDELEREFGTASRGAGQTGETVVPGEISFGDSSRGYGGTLALRVLRVLKIDLAGATATQIAERLEERLVPEPGLYRCSETGALGDRILEPLVLPKDRKLLIFLHGTASTTSKSFSALFMRRNVTKRLFNHYEGQIYAPPLGGRMGLRARRAPVGGEAQVYRVPFIGR